MWWSNRTDQKIVSYVLHIMDTHFIVMLEQKQWFELNIGLMILSSTFIDFICFSTTFLSSYKPLWPTLDCAWFKNIYFTFYFIDRTRAYIFSVAKERNGGNKLFINFIYTYRKQTTLKAEGSGCTAVVCSTFIAKIIRREFFIFGNTSGGKLLLPSFNSFRWSQRLGLEVIPASPRDSPCNINHLTFILWPVSQLFPDVLNYIVYVSL